MEVTKQIGGPGCGKTSYIMGKIEKDLQFRLFPSEICAVSLTRAAIRTIKFRMKKKMNVEPEAMPYFGTIHSNCFHLQGCPAVCTEYKAAKFPDYDRDKHARMDIARNQLAAMPDDLTKYHADFKDWLSESDMSDFTAMLETVLQYGIKMPVKHLYCDESQDQTPLAHAVVKMWARETEKFISVGDGDQALYRFTGALPESFIDMSYDFMGIRHQSYRLPLVIHGHCREIIENVQHRDDNPFRPVTPDLVERQKKWNPERLPYSEGQILYDQPEPDLSLPGTHMILARVNSPYTPTLDKWKDWLYANNIPFHNPYRLHELTWNPTETKSWKAVATYMRLLGGLPCKMSDLRDMARVCKAKEVFERGRKKQFLENLADGEEEQFGLLSHGFRHDFIFAEKPDFSRFFNLKGQAVSLIENIDPNQLREKPKVVLGTIHSVKGGEADHVWIDMGTSGLLRDQFIRNKPHVRDDEFRAWYVAASRARHTVGYLTTLGVKNPVHI